jgi:hypothetical protein
MIGNNVFLFNTATMMEAMQEYLDKRMSEYAPQVTNVNYESQTNGTFRVTLTDRESSK